MDCHQMGWCQMINGMKEATINRAKNSNEDTLKCGEEKQKDENTNH